MKVITGNQKISGHKARFYERGTAHPDYNRATLADSYAAFVRRMVAFSPLIDPTHRRIVLKRENFPKLINMKRADGGERGKATKLLEAIEDGRIVHGEGAFRNGEYTWERDRIETLFWLPDLIANPDAIYKNGHKIIQGDRVFVKVYDKLGSKIKLAFTQRINRQGPDVVITSFLTNPDDAASYVQGLPLYQRPSRDEETLALAAVAPKQ